MHWPQNGFHNTRTHIVDNEMGKPKKEQKTIPRSVQKRAGLEEYLEENNERTSALEGSNND